MEDYYRILDVPRVASFSEIKSAYRKLAFRFHPDRNPDDPRAEDKLKQINAAFEVLGDLDRRWEYDRKLLAAYGIFGPSGSRRDDAPKWSTEPDISPSQLRRAFEGYPNVVDFRDILLGALLSISVTVGLKSEPGFTNTLFTSLSSLAVGILGYSMAQSGLTAFRARYGGPLEGWLSVAFGASLVLLSTGGGALVGAELLAGLPHTVVRQSGMLYAVAGGMMGGGTGAAAGRIFHSVIGRPAGWIAGAASGATMSGLIGGFLWYWGAVFRWIRFPVNDDLSILAVSGVIGCIFGGALAGVIGSMRDV